MNLTASTEGDEAVDRLVIEPLVALRAVPGPFGRMLDVGSGGGSPAIPLKLARPEAELLMVEPKARKAAFLREAVRHLGLHRATVESARYEELLTHPDLHESMDIVTVRALRIEPKTLLALQAFAKAGGLLLLFRGATGPSTPEVTPPLAWEATVPLLESLRSRLTLLRKVGVRS